MSIALRPVRVPRHPLVGLLSRLGAIVLTIGTGVLLGLQYITPNKRVLSVLVAALLFGLTWRLDMISGLGVLALALPFPRGTVFGNTNLAFILLLLVLWLLRVTQRQSAPPRRSPLDAPILLLFISYVVSFYNISDSTSLARGLERFELMVAGWLMFYVIMSNLQTEQAFRRFLGFQAVSVLLVCLLAVFELNHPGQPFIRGWISFQHTIGTEFNTRNVRVGSSFYDFELLSEYCALNALLVLFLFLRAESGARRVAYGGLLFLVVFVLFATLTKGAFVALAVGALYFLWLVRRRLTFVGVVTGLALVVSFWGMNFYVAHFTRSGDLIMRFIDSSRFVGFMPESRVGAWTGAWERILQHPLIGHGPYYSARTGTRIWFWPHCLYLYVGNNVGFIGLGIFLWLLWRLFRISRPVTDDLRRGRYLQSYMIVAHVQMVVFMVDQIKIEYLRNLVYQFQVWLMFALIVAAHQIAHPAAAQAGQPQAPGPLPPERRADRP